MLESRKKIELSKIKEIIKFCLKYSQISFYSSKKSIKIPDFEVEGYNYETNYILNTTKEDIFLNYSLFRIQNPFSKSIFLDIFHQILLTQKEN